jgi:hypothetical protein
VDFDGTIVKDNYPEIGEPNLQMIAVLKNLSKMGVKLILWTCRDNDLAQEAVEFCKSYGLEFNAVNENVIESKTLTGNDNRKVYADLYIDDKAISHDRGYMYWVGRLGFDLFDFERGLRGIEEWQ